jgi:SEC-C motif domain protein
VNDDVNCPCQSGKKYSACCGRFITQQAWPENAEQLMRSRYTAYVLKQRDYLLDTWQPQHRPSDLVLDDSIRWLGLTIIEAQPAEGSNAIVEFEARMLVNGAVDAIHERSRFVLEQGRWIYTHGEMLTPSFQSWKPGRNEACPCGSGKKFKRCCAG